MVQVAGAKAIAAKLKAIQAAKTKALNNGLKLCGLLLFRESQRIVPVDYGNLKASGFVRTEGKQGSKQIDVVVVGYTAAYAVYVHEDLEAAHGAVFNEKYAEELKAARAAKRRGESVTGPFRHNRGADQQAKFLEKPFRELRQQFAAIMAASVRSANK